jgi:hypothetical protein
MRPETTLNLPINLIKRIKKASGGTRTRNLRFTKPLLCQLSYAGEVKIDRISYPLSQRLLAERSQNDGNSCHQHRTRDDSNCQTCCNLKVRVQTPRRPQLSKSLNPTTKWSLNSDLKPLSSDAESPNFGESQVSTRRRRQKSASEIVQIIAKRHHTDWNPRWRPALARLVTRILSNLYTNETRLQGPTKVTARHVD